MISSGRRGARLLAAAAVLLLATAVPATGSATETTGGENAAPESTAQRVGSVFGKIGEVTLEVTILRPVGAAATAVGFAFFVASLPFVAPNLEIDTSWETFVETPGEFTFTRPIGEF